jgi:hypothetical protein
MSKNNIKISLDCHFKYSRAQRLHNNVCQIWNLQLSRLAGFRIGPTREEVARNSAPAIQSTLEQLTQRDHCRLYICVGPSAVQKRGTPRRFVLRTEVVCRCIRHSGYLICTLREPCGSFISRLFLLLKGGMQTFETVAKCETSSRLIV